MPLRPCRSSTEFTGKIKCLRDNSGATPRGSIGCQDEYLISRKDMAPEIPSFICKDEAGSTVTRPIPGTAPSVFESATVS